MEWSLLPSTNESIVYLSSKPIQNGSQRLIVWGLSQDNPYNPRYCGLVHKSPDPLPNPFTVNILMDMVDQNRAWLLPGPPTHVQTNCRLDGTVFYGEVMNDADSEPVVSLTKIRHDIPLDDVHHIVFYHSPDSPVSSPSANFYQEITNIDDVILFHKYLQEYECLRKVYLECTRETEAVRRISPKKPTEPKKRASESVLRAQYVTQKTENERLSAIRQSVEEFKSGGKQTLLSTLAEREKEILVLQQENKLRLLTQRNNEKRSQAIAEIANECQNAKNQHLSEIEKLTRQMEKIQSDIDRSRKSLEISFILADKLNAPQTDSKKDLSELETMRSVLSGKEKELGSMKWTFSVMTKALNQIFSKRERDQKLNADECTQLRARIKLTETEISKKQATIAENIKIAAAAAAAAANHTPRLSTKLPPPAQPPASSNVIPMRFGDVIPQRSETTAEQNSNDSEHQKNEIDATVSAELDANKGNDPTMSAEEEGAGGIMITQEPTTASEENAPRNHNVSPLYTSVLQLIEGIHGEFPDCDRLKENVIQLLSEAQKPVDLAEGCLQSLMFGVVSESDNEIVNVKLFREIATKTKGMASVCRPKIVTPFLATICCHGNVEFLRSSLEYLQSEAGNQELLFGPDVILSACAHETRRIPLVLNLLIMSPPSSDLYNERDVVQFLSIHTELQNLFDSICCLTATSDESMQGRNEVCERLLSHPTLNLQVTVEDIEGKSTLLKIAESGNVQILKLVLQYRPSLDVNVIGSCNESILSLAIKSKKIEIVRMLLEISQLNRKLVLPDGSSPHTLALSFIPEETTIIEALQ